MIAKGSSTRLKGKNKKHFLGEELFKYNLKKMLNLFGKVLLDSDDDYILEEASLLGVVPHKRKTEVLGNEIPSITIFKSILDDFPETDGFLNIQANSPNVPSSIIQRAFDLLCHGYCEHLLSLNTDLSWNGSIWGISRNTLYGIKDPYQIKPDFYIVDDSIDIHTQEEFDLARKIEEKA